MQCFSSRVDASKVTADMIVAKLALGLSHADRATLVVSGGGTPIACLRYLSNTELPWHRIDVTLTDERNVPAQHADSNEKMVRENLLINKAAAATFHQLNQRTVKAIGPLTCTLAGMGEDGHFASIFPDSPQLGEALSTDASVLQITTPSSPYSRTTMSFGTLSSSQLLLLLVFGESKRRIIKTPSGFPVDKLIKFASPTIIWAA